MRFLRFFGFFVFVGVIAVFLLRLTFPLPDISERPHSAAQTPDPDNPLAQMVSTDMAANPGKSGVVPLFDGTAALAARIAMINAARHSIESQYYIWHDDTSGVLMFEALLDAAERGVHVRLLLDDNGIPGLDSFVAALNTHRNFEIRLFNPSTVRSPKLLGYTFDFFRMNRRMHNKSLIVDGAMTIIGGRNIGDEYFQVGEDQFYVDLDVLAAGAIVADTTTVFDDYWNSISVHASETIIDGTGDLGALRKRIAQVHESSAAKTFLSEAETILARMPLSGALEWTSVQLVADDPIKGQGVARRDQLMITRLSGFLGAIETRLDLISAYFVPGSTGTQIFSDLARSGKTVNILTNALNTTDVLMVHSGYTKYRRELLEAGVNLFELKLRGGAESEADLQLLPLGLSGASLHAKTFAVDGKRIFIGSFNFDPRSAMLNCEMGFLIDSPTLASRISGAFDGPLKAVSYRPALTPETKMIWREDLLQGDPNIYQQEPGASWTQQIALTIIGLLPVEWLL
ncbi:phospholipase D family protein [Alisedimentitalea sp. MJ-SS2]|uniref:phospholipase D-like domain-containing protein n=1 Tax=Aliisedimentitalea sp. MJ-SS2 TaxID=3049795 RepID=UPI00291041B8|nr:phospholipase D family protein [Alisedimentitalea sp. MJ-SS2]MDU8928895.1 phospholipase D family protein [Alisedimentitalea sp. MJ-SS2]